MAEGGRLLQGAENILKSKLVMVTRLGICTRSYRIADLKRLAYGKRELHLTTAVLS